MKTVLFIRTRYFNRPKLQARLVGVHQYARLHGWTVRVVEAPHEQDIPSLLKFWNPIGCILEAGSWKEVYPKRLFGRCPIVYLDRDPEMIRDAFCVAHDPKATSALAAKELLALGFPHVAFVPYFSPVSWSQNREREFVEAMRLNGKDVQVFRTTETSETVAWRRNLMTWLAALPKPCAVFAANDLMGEAVIQTAAELGINVPKELAVLSVDNTEVTCENTRPKLSSIAMDYIGAGVMSAQLLAERLTDPTLRPCCRYFGPLAVVRRESTRKIADGTDARVAAALELINREACAHLTVVQVAATMKCSRRMAELLFRNTTGKSILETIQDVRVERACSLLKTTRATVNAIANMCGYSKDVFLQKLFRERFGVSMSGWRQKALTPKFMK